MATKETGVEPASQLANTTASGITAPIAQSSIAVRGNNPGEVTVRFRKWTAHGTTAYQKGEYAGFPEATALELYRAGAAELSPAYMAQREQRNGSGPHMVRK